MKITSNEIAVSLWKLLDDIDTASDVFKPNNLESYIEFYNYTMRKVEERYKYLKSDGYELYDLNLEEQNDPRRNA